MKLHNISKDYIGFLESDLPQEELKDCLDNIEGAFEEKGHNIVAVLNSLDSDTTSIDNEIKRLKDRKTSIVNNKKRLVEYLRYNMEETGITKIKHPLFNITLRKGQDKAVVTDIDLIPDYYITIRTEIKPDLNKIKKAIKDGEIIEGVEMVTGKSSVLIK